MSNPQSFDDSGHRLFVKWMELQRARAYVIGEIPEERAVAPWESSNPSIKECWKSLTRPSNLEALRVWLAGSSDEKRNLWTEHAIKDAERRSKGETPEA